MKIGRNPPFDSSLDLPNCLKVFVAQNYCAKIKFILKYGLFYPPYCLKGFVAKNYRAEIKSILKYGLFPTLRLQKVQSSDIV